MNSHSGKSNDHVKVSVALCTYNGELYIEEQLRSILNQSRKVEEIIVADDGSSDSTVEIIRQIASEQGGITPVFTFLPGTQQIGVSANFQRALGAASGDILFLADQDDVWNLQKVERILSVFRSDPTALMVFSNALLVDAQGKSLNHSVFEGLRMTHDEIHKLEQGDGLSVLLRRNVVTGATAAFARSLLQKALPVPDGWIHDEWLAFVASLFGGLRLIDEPLIHYRQHGKNAIGVMKPTFRMKIRKLREPRSERNDNLLQRALNLSVWAEMSSLPVAVRELISEKLHHEHARNSFPASRLRRLPSVFREWRTGRYEQFGLGRQDVLRDFLQPDGYPIRQTLG